MEVRTGIPKRRLALIVLGEVVLIAAFAFSVWQVWQAREAAIAGPPASSVPAPAATGAPAATPIPLPQDGTAAPSPTPAPGSGGETASTLLQHLAQFNGLVSTIEQAETGVLQILIPGSVWYLKHVLVPRVEAALSGH